MQASPNLTSQSALFLDFDGTLVAIAETPDRVRVAPHLCETLAGLQSLLGGALGTISGRQIAALDHFLKPLVLPAAGEHGMQRRSASGRLHEQPPADLSAVRQAADDLSTRHPGVMAEHKQAAVAVHYRLAPEWENACREAMSRVVSGDPRLEVLFGKCVVEVKPAGVNKGLAIQAFMEEAPFLGRTPFFFGDDTTDESGLAMVQSMGGVAVKVGPGPSCAEHHIADSAAVNDWLAQQRDLLTRATAVV